MEVWSVKSRAVLIIPCSQHMGGRAGKENKRKKNKWEEKRWKQRKPKVLSTWREQVVGAPPRERRTHGCQCVGRRYNDSRALHSRIRGRGEWRGRRQSRHHDWQQSCTLVDLAGVIGDVRDTTVQRQSGKFTVGPEGTVDKHGRRQSEHLGNRSCQRVSRCRHHRQVQVLGRGQACLACQD